VSLSLEAPRELFTLVGGVSLVSRCGTAGLVQPDSSDLAAPLRNFDGLGGVCLRGHHRPHKKSWATLSMLILTRWTKTWPKTVFGTVEAVKTVSDLFSPSTGTVLEINDKLAIAPETVIRTLMKRLDGEISIIAADSKRCS
jgi:hypothetical protein